MMPAIPTQVYAQTQARSHEGVRVCTFLRLAFMVLVLMSSGMGGCATGQTYQTLETKIPPLAPGLGRIFFFRDPMYAGSAVQPQLMLNGQDVGKVVPGGFFFLDRPPGEQHIYHDNAYLRGLSFGQIDSSKVELSEKVFSLKAGQTRYVYLQIRVDGSLFYFRPWLLHPIQGQSIISKRRYTGPDEALMPEP